MKLQIGLLNGWMETPLAVQQANLFLIMILGSLRAHDCPIPQPTCRPFGQLSFIPVQAVTL